MTGAMFEEFFLLATGEPPFPYQRRLAEDGDWPARIEVPTGLGKTLAVVVAWLWRRQRRPSRTPRRLVYCLPMRVLVEQTRDVVASVLEKLGSSVRIVTLMGGVEDEREWDTRVEDDLIILGTQDMLLSRALNRGYGMSRYRWPLHFGLLNADALWVVDEVQLVGAGVATTAQLQSMRRKLGTALPVKTSWMSATLDDQWLRTVDVDDVDLAGHVTLEASDRDNPIVARRVGAAKALSRANARMGDAARLAAEILGAHRAGTRTLAIVNTVDRARDLFVRIQKAKPAAEVVLLHSRFRACGRADAVDRALAAPGPPGTIVVSTQVIEAGVDLTSATLFTEVAPWASLVQRFGRCNRRGDDEGASVRWISLPDDAKERAKLERPYALDALTDSESALAELSEVGPAALPRRALRLEPGAVLRRRDLLDLFDTTPDLAGNDVDVSRFIRDTDDNDARVFWRNVGGAPAASEPSPARDELCAAPLGVIREWLDGKARRAMWTWDGLRGEWASVERVRPGLTILLDASSGGYDETLGLDPKSTSPVAVVAHPTGDADDRVYEGDPESEWSEWYTLTRHSADVAAEAGAIARTLGIGDELATALVTAGRWHDAGKAHRVWQEAAKRVGTDPPPEPVAKTNAQRGRIVFRGRPGFRHELASALLALQNGLPDLVSYLVACHHGKVRLSLRSLPTERAPTNARGEADPDRRFARGIWEGDVLPAIDLGDGVAVAETTLTLSYMELGDDPGTGRSWAARTLALRDAPSLGPFRLGFLEALIKCADERASRAARGKP